VGSKQDIINATTPKERPKMYSGAPASHMVEFCFCWKMKAHDSKARGRRG
jgi:hypothetical protein